VPTFRFVLQLALGIVLPLLVQRWDRRRLGPLESDRAWNAASWGSALFNFGELSIVAWFWVTRRFRWSSLLGLPISLALFVFDHWAIDGLVAQIAGAKPPAPIIATVATWTLMVLALAPIWGISLVVEAIATRRWRRALSVQGPAPGVEDRE
jgi:hypothetical protein